MPGEDGRGRPRRRRHPQACDRRPPPEKPGSRSAVARDGAPGRAPRPCPPPDTNLAPAAPLPLDTGAGAPPRLRARARGRRGRRAGRSVASQAAKAGPGRAAGARPAGRGSSRSPAVACPAGQAPAARPADRDSPLRLPRPSRPLARAPPFHAPSSPMATRRPPRPGPPWPKRAPAAQRDQVVGTGRPATARPERRMRRRCGPRRGGRHRAGTRARRPPRFSKGRPRALPGVQGDTPSAPPISRRPAQQRGWPARHAATCSRGPQGQGRTEAPPPSHAAAGPRRRARRQSRIGRRRVAARSGRDGCRQA